MLRPICVFFVACGFWICAGQTVFAQCVQVALINDSGNIVTPGGLVTGFKIGEDIVFNIVLPPHREQKEARPVSCPLDLVTEIRTLYNRSCTSDRARRQAAETNNTTLNAVIQRCAKLESALLNSH